MKIMKKKRFTFYLVGLKSLWRNIKLQDVNSWLIRSYTANIRKLRVHILNSEKFSLEQYRGRNLEFTKQ